MCCRNALLRSSAQCAVTTRSALSQSQSLCRCASHVVLELGVQAVAAEHDDERQRLRDARRRVRHEVCCGVVAVRQLDRPLFATERADDKRRDKKRSVHDGCSEARRRGAQRSAAEGGSCRASDVLSVTAVKEVQRHHYVRLHARLRPASRPRARAASAQF